MIQSTAAAKTGRDKDVNVLTGSVEETILSPRRGVVFSLRAYPVIEEGSLVARIFGGVTNNA